MKRVILGAAGVFLLAAVAGAWTLEETDAGQSYMFVDSTSGNEARLTFRCDGAQIQAVLTCDGCQGKPGEKATVDHELDNGMPAVTVWEKEEGSLILKDAIRLALWSRDADTMKVGVPRVENPIETEFTIDGLGEALWDLPCGRGVAK